MDVQQVKQLIRKRIENYHRWPPRDGYHLGHQEALEVVLELLDAAASERDESSTYEHVRPASSLCLS